MTGAQLRRWGPKLLALLFAGGILLCAAWYLTAYHPYNAYVSALRAQPGWWEDPGFPECGVDAKGYSCNVARPGFLSWTGNLGLGMPAAATEDGEDPLFTDTLIIWPLAGGGTEQGVILYEYEADEEGVSCAGHQLYIDREGNYLPYGDTAEDAANRALLEGRRETVQTLLERAREIWGLP